jgi:hypothetical protein
MMIAPLFAAKVLDSIKATAGQTASWERRVSDYLSTQGGAKITQINDETRKRIMSIVDEMTGEGKSLREIAAAINSNVILEQIIAKRAMVIAHTETLSASNWGSLMGAKSSGADVRKQWISTRDDATRGLKPTDEFDHWHMDSKEAELDDLFDVPMRPAGVEPMQFPGDPSGSAGNVINCLLPGATMEGDFNAVLKSVYSGPAIEIATRGGRRLSVTLNHPIMTTRGLVPAGGLAEGDELVCKRGNVRMNALAGPRCKDDKDAPTAVEKIFESLSLSHPVRVVVVRGFDLHGDAIFGNGDVEVVVPHGELLLNGNPAESQNAGELAFQLANPEESMIHSSGSPYPPLHRVFLSTTSIPCGRALSFNSDPVPLKSGPFQSLRLGLSSRDDAALGEMSHQRGSRDTGSLRKLIHRHSLAIETDEVVDVRYFKFSGHVYDLQSVYGLNIANGIVISNCRCTIGYLRKG